VNEKENTKKHEGCEFDEYIAQSLRAFSMPAYLISHLKMGKLYLWATVLRGLSAAISTGIFLLFLKLAITVLLCTLYQKNSGFVKVSA
jgi:hypothetical protein